MNVTLNVKENNSNKRDISALRFENKFLSKDIKILIKNIAKLEKIKEKQIQEQSAIDNLYKTNEELKKTAKNLSEKARQLMKELVV